jgi:hypothetical protein
MVVFHGSPPERDFVASAAAVAAEVASFISPAQRDDRGGGEASCRPRRKGEYVNNLPRCDRSEMMHLSIKMKYSVHQF